VRAKTSARSIFFVCGELGDLGRRRMTTLKTALVTGASRGIGRGVAIELGRAGYRVAINYAGNVAAADEEPICLRQARRALTGFMRLT